MSAKKRDPIKAGVEAALKLGAARPWAEITLAEIADEAGLKLSEFYDVADKDSLSDAVEPYFDKAMSAEAADMDDTPRERLFDVIMRRFEAMEPHREGLLSLMKWRDRSPPRLAALLRARQRTAKWALACAGLDGSTRAPVSAKAANAGWAMARAERAWRKETSADFSRTMAALDKELRDAEDRLNALRMFRGRRRRPNAAGEGGPEAPPGATPQE
ncbi:MAG: hypothetical protein AAFX03_07140 [Pseudomonadota bacterium]